MKAVDDSDKAAFDRHGIKYWPLSFLGLLPSLVGADIDKRSGATLVELRKI